MPIVLQPVDQAAHAELAQRLACWAKTVDGTTDLALIYQTCCVSPTGQTLGRWTIPDALCAEYGPLPFTGNQGQTITCPPTAAEIMPYYIWDDDVEGIDPNTCSDGALAAPTGLAAPAATDTSVDLTWNPVVNATSYTVQWSLSPSGVWTSMPETTDTTQTVTGLSAGTAYRFRVRAHAADWADSPWSTVVTESTAAALLPPANLTAGTPGTTDMPLSWTAAAGADTYTVQWSPAGASTWTDIAGIAGTSTTVTGLTAATAYDFRVKTVAAGFADSAWSPILTDSTALASPTGLDTTGGLTATTITMQWNAVTGADQYRMRWSLAGAGTWTQLPSTASTSDTATGLEPETSYDLQVKAISGSLTDSAWSDTHTASTTPVPQLPAPTDLASPSQTASSVDLTWTAVTDADNYVVRWSLAGAGTWTNEDPVATEADTVTGLSASTSYDFQVKATGTDWVDSDWSATFTQATTA